MNPFVIGFVAWVIIAYAAFMLYVITKERRQMRRREQEWKAIQERGDHIIRGDRPILWEGEPTDEEKAAAIDFIRGEREIIRWEVKT